jgi:hypothetical protein
MSKEAHLSLAMLTAYLNDVWFSSNCLLTYQKKKIHIYARTTTLVIFFLGSSIDAHCQGKQWGTQGDIEIPKVSS